MNRLYTSLRRVTGNDARVLKTIHVLCATICGSLACGSFWLANQPNVISQADIELPLRVEEAEGLVANASQWIAGWEQERASEKSLQEAAVKAISWVPQQLDWQRTMADLQSLATACELQLVEIRPGDEFEGPRVAIRTAICQLEGSYESVCKFLDGLMKLEYPVWASELTMQNNSKGEPFAVVVHLRIPVAGTRSASAFLIEQIEQKAATVPPDARTSKLEVVATSETPQHG